MPNKSFVEDMMTLGTGMLSNLAEARHEIKAQARQRAATLARDIDLVTRDEFDAAFAMLARARDMQEELAARLARVEAKLGLSAPRASAGAAKAGTKKPVKGKKANLPSVKSRQAKRRGK